MVSPCPSLLFYCTVICTLAVVRPYAFVAYSVYVVVAAGDTLAELPRTAPTSGDTITYDAPDTSQVSVTAVPAEIDIAEAVKLEIVGLGPLGTFALVYSGEIWITSKSPAVAPSSRCKSSLFHRSSGVPVIYTAEPLSARISPYCFMAFKIT